LLQIESGLTPRVSCAAGRRRERAGRGLAASRANCEAPPKIGGKNERHNGGGRSLRSRSRPGQGRASGVGCTALVGGQARPAPGAERPRHAARRDARRRIVSLHTSGAAWRRPPVQEECCSEHPAAGRSIEEPECTRRRSSVPHDGGHPEKAADCPSRWWWMRPGGRLFIAIVAVARRRPAAYHDTGYSEPAARSA
jgi:hypothetical protein